MFEGKYLVYSRNLPQTQGLKIRSENRLIICLFLTNHCFETFLIKFYFKNEIKSVLKLI